MSTGNVIEYKFFLNHLDSIMANIVKDVFSIPTQDIHKRYLVMKKY